MRLFGSLRQVATARWPITSQRLSCSNRVALLARSSSSQHAAPPPSQSVARLLESKTETEHHPVVVNGYVRSVRSMKTASFVALGDGSSLAPLQAIVPVDQANGLSVGAAVRLVGAWVPSPGRGQAHELRVDEVQVLGPSDAKTFPVQKKYHTPEFLRTIPHLRHRTPFNSTLLRLRSDLIRSMSHFFAMRDFVQTHPPILTSSDCEGAGEVFEVHPAASAHHPAAEPFFSEPKYLTVSAQLHLEALAQSVGNVWTLAPTFRAEKSDTPRHLSEFYMLEAEMSFVRGSDAVMDLIEDLLRFAAKELSGTRIRDELLHRSRDGADDLAPPDQVRRRWGGIMAEAWPRITYTEAIRLLEADSTSNPDLFSFTPAWGRGLQAEHEKHIATVVGGGSPVFVTQYPRDIKAFYMLQSPSSGAGPSARETVDCFDLLVPDLCEIAGGSMREHRLQPLLAAMKQRGMVPPDADGSHAGPLDWYVDLRRWGCPPHGGFGIGFDRLLCYLSGVQSIRDMVAFPRWYGRCDC